MTEGITPLSDILADNTDDAAPRDERGRFAPKVEAEPSAVETGETATEADPPQPVQEVPPTPEPDHEPQAIPFKALKDERAKRQQLEAELAELRRQITQPQPPQQPAFQQPQAPETAPDRWEDPEGHDRWLMTQAASAARQEALETVRIERVTQTAMAARQRYQDFDTVVGTFQQLASMNPVLEQQMLQQPDPAEWAYRTAKTHLEVSQYGSLDAAVEARVQAKLAEEMAKLQKQAAAPAPVSLATERNVGSRTNPVPWNGPTPIASILSR
jgi:hypothetical protein